jgi:hypothetical protein
MPSSVTERVRIHRKRHRNGLHSIRVLLHESEIDSLVRDGYLKQERRRLPDAIRGALNAYICDKLGGPLEE